MKYLITNSDDFGLTRSITDAIIDTHINGFMKSTTIMCNMDGTDYAIKKAKEISTLSVGIHFNLTEGKPLSDPSKVPDLLDENGFFKKNIEQRGNFLYGKSKQTQVELELQNQLEYLLDFGLIPTHFDSHHHITGTPIAFRASLNVARKFGINRARITNTDFLYLKSYKNLLNKVKHRVLNSPKAFLHDFNKRILVRNKFITPDYKVLPFRVLPANEDYIQQFINALSVLKEGITEISFHPGFKGSYLHDSAKTAQIRIRDMEIAKSSRVYEYIKNNKIQLISFKDLK